MKHLNFCKFSYRTKQTGRGIEVSRYIHLNPVRAKMAAQPEEYRWSSFRSYVRANWAASWIVCDKVLGEFCRDLTSARRAYGRFVSAGIDEPPPSPLAAAVGGPCWDRRSS